ncbi:MAG: 1-(5-phosphoribosyl)-5-[(5-phosphoribosylamino)methylideneamino]imidazole-4-carboxamide isomerase [Deltaproteobacteria bacterium]|nr:1-(5-phosphoribosyl)-5-[(5-phosphoribosylamino)methylideneamino]imidazole-4-carboxamide isomerase [Deltaproteobacteria bacterium]
MIVIPAIDLMDGKAVRLERGDAERVTEYHDEPVRLVEDFVRKGANRIHVVDLDGAFDGKPKQLSLIAEIAEAAREHGATVQTGGGLRTLAAVQAVLDAGVDHAVVGTLAVREPEWVELLCQQNPNRIIVAADARDGVVAVNGWTEASTMEARALAEAAQHWGAAAVLYTDVTRDGMQGGPAVEATAALQRGLEIPVLASGGVGALADLDACAAAGIHGVVLGRALYEGAFSLTEALARC